MIDKLLKMMEGNWKVQKTVYNLKTGKTNHFNYSLILESTNQNKIHDLQNYSISHNNSYHNTILNSSIENNTSFIYKIHKNIKQGYHINTKNYKYIRLLYQDNEINFKEIVNIINTNFFITTGTIKTDNQCQIISFTSYIKII